MLQKVIVILVLSMIGIASAQTPQTGPKHNKTVVCYVSSWAIYRPGLGSYSIDDFDPSLCTIAIYAFAGLDAEKNHIKSLDPWQDLEDDGGKAGYRRLVQLKRTNPHLKVLIAIGGWNEGSQNYSVLAGHPESRRTFVKQASEFVRQHNFDGLDLDWEYPTLRGGEKQDKENFVLLVKELHEEFKKYRLHLSSAFGAAKKTIDSAYDIKRLSQYLDTMHIMCYDYYGSWDKKVGYNSPLNSENDLNVDFSINYFLKLGAPAEKLIMGVPFYGRTFVGSNHEGNIGDSASDIGFKGPFTRENGFMGYNELCSVLSNQTAGWTTTWDSKSAEAIAKLKNSETGEIQVVTYDSSRSIANKVRYAIRQKLGGIMVWSVDTDAFRNTGCIKEEDAFVDFKNSPGITLTIPRRRENNYPLLRTLNEAVIVSLDELQQEKDIDPSNNEVGPNSSTDKEKGATGKATKSLVNSLLILGVTAILSIFL